MRHFVFMIGLLLSMNLQARDFEDGFATFGAGAKPCSEYSQAVKQGGGRENFFIDWVIGYFSAFNVIMPETYNILGEMDFPRVQAWLNERCKKYPHELFVNSVARMTQILYPMRYKSALKKQPSAGTQKKPSVSLKDVSKSIKK